MGKVIDFDTAAAIIRDDTPAHVDEYSFALLSGVLGDLVVLRESEKDKARAAELRETAAKLHAVLMRFNPPQGAA